MPPGAFGSTQLVVVGHDGHRCFIEGTAFALAIGAYFFLMTRLPSWPPSGLIPNLRWGTINTLVLLLSLVPNELAKRGGEHVELGAVRLWMTVCVLFGLLFNLVRVFEFRHLNVMWDHSSLPMDSVWLLLGLHTTHIVTDFLDTIVLTALMFVGPVEERRFVDVEENAAYWYPVVLAWLPIYGVIYWVPRLS